MGAQLHTKGAMSDLNLTPLIDIVLVVLIIMMVNIPIQVEEMGIKLPSTIAPPPQTETPPEQLVVAIYEDGTLALNRRLMAEDVLTFELMRRLRSAEHKSVFIDAAPLVLYGRVVDMMDLAREGGADKVGLAKLKEQGPLPPTEVAPGSLPRGVTVGLAAVVGALSQKDADEALKPVLPTLMGCYEQALARKPDTSGRVMLMVTVAPDGSLMSHEISSSNVGEEGLDTCVDQAAEQKLRFEPLGDPGKTARVQYPLLFSPG